MRLLGLVIGALVILGSAFSFAAPDLRLSLERSVITPATGSDQAHPAAKSQSTLQRRCKARCSEASKHPIAQSRRMKRGGHPYTIRFMRVVNRTAVTITGAKPYIDWMRRTDADFNKGAITVPRVKAYGSAFLLPEFGLEEDLQEWVEENALWLFEFQLAAWTEIEATWPPT